MNKFIECLLKFTTIADKYELDYAVIGAVAVSIYTLPRTTQDIDFLVDIKELKFMQFLDELKKEGFWYDEERIKKDFTERYLLELYYMGIYVDILLPFLPFFYKVIKQVRIIKVFDKDIKVAKEEDLIILKLLSGRTIDKADIEMVKDITENLDVSYIEENLNTILGKEHTAFKEFCKIFYKEDGWV